MFIYEAQWVEIKVKGTKKLKISTPAV